MFKLICVMVVILVAAWVFGLMVQKKRKDRR